MRPVARHTVLGFAIAAVGAAIVAGLMTVGSPAAARERRLDGRRVGDLIELTTAVNTFWTTHTRLPVSLDELLQDPRSTIRTRDPLTDQPYAFRPLDARAYELCADFQRAWNEDRPGGVSRFWSHGPGRRCFHLEATPAKQP